MFFPFCSSVPERKTKAQVSNNTQPFPLLAFPLSYTRAIVSTALGWDTGSCQDWLTLHCDSLRMEAISSWGTHSIGALGVCWMLVWQQRAGKAFARVQSALSAVFLLLGHLCLFTSGRKGAGRPKKQFYQVRPDEPICLIVTYGSMEELSRSITESPIPAGVVIREHRITGTSVQLRGSTHQREPSLPSRCSLL